MKYKNGSQDHKQQTLNPVQSATRENLARQAADYAPSPDEVARRAYFTYENEGSLPGRDVQHWLAAEAELITERNLTRVHGFHNVT